mmetsp:Transcript_47495/g.125939  ORF Transcript_47495/g.125939 Transcript_47495/m.125939 type:complete len:246 (+) Transcript_47495:572-1309(+)
MRPKRPRVMPRFCLRENSACSQGFAGLVRAPPRACTRLSTWGPKKSGPTRTEISPIAHDALFRTDAEVSPSAVVQSGNTSGKSCVKDEMHFEAHVPTRAKPLCFTRCSLSLSTPGITRRKFWFVSNCGVCSPNPSTMPASRSTLAATSSRFGFSNSLGFCSHIRAARKPSWIIRTHRATILGTNVTRDGPRCCTMLDKHSNRASVVMSLSGMVSKFRIIGTMRACTYSGLSNPFPLAQARVPMAS